MRTIHEHAIALPRTGRSFRLGISGVPGVGKSTFIETLGLHLIGLGHRRIGFVGSPDNPSFRERYNTYLGGMAAAGHDGAGPLAM